jgi:ATP-dependent DNA helicase RecG
MENIVSDVTGGSREKSSEKSSEKIMNIMKDNPLVTIEELSVLLNKTTRTIEKNLYKLKALGLIVREGPDKGGHWKVLK